MNPPIFNLEAIRPGDIIHRRSRSVMGFLIRLRTGGPGNHDAICIEHNGRKYFGDALMGSRAQLTPPEEWEADCRKNGSRVLVLRPAAADKWNGEAAAWWWQTNVLGRAYDSLAIFQLAYRWLADKFRHKLGHEERFYCTEGCRDAWQMGSYIDPWAPKLNVTPGTTYKRLKQGRFKIVEAAITAAGQRHRINIRG